MNEIRILLFLFTWGCTIPLSAQSVDDLEHLQDRYPNDDAVFLKHKQDVWIEIENGEPVIYSRQYEEKMILRGSISPHTEESFSWSSGFSEITEIEAKTLEPRKNRFKKHKIREFVTRDELDNAIFHDDKKKTTIYYPHLSTGAITVLEYTKKINQPHFFPGFFFGSYYPIEHAEFTVSCPAEVNLQFEKFNVDGINLKFTREEYRSETVYKWVMNRAESFDFEEDAPNPKYILPHIYGRITTYEWDGQEKNVLRDVDDLYDWYSSLITEVNQNSGADLQLLVDSITQNEDTDYGKVESIYYWVQENIKYIAFEDGFGGFIPREAQLVCDRRFGDCKDMANIITHMSKLAGVKTSLTWIGTRDIPYSYKTLPTPSVDNHMIAAYRADDGYIFLDATSSNLPFGMPSIFIQGKEALVNVGDDYEIVSVPAVPSRDNRFLDTVNITLDGTTVKGRGKSELTGYFKSVVRDLLKDRDEEVQSKRLRSYYQKGSNKFLLNGFTYSDPAHAQQPTTIRYEFNIADYATKAADEIYLNMFLERPYRHAEIKEDRKYPFEKNFQNIQSYTVVLDIPEGYELTFLPDGGSFEHEEFGFNYAYTSGDDQVSLAFEIHFRYLMLEEPQFKGWNEMIIELDKAYNKVIILKKANHE